MNFPSSGGSLSPTQTAALLSIPVGSEVPDLGSLTVSSSGGTTFTVEVVAATQGARKKIIARKLEEAALHLGRATTAFTGTEFITRIKADDLIGNVWDAAFVRESATDNVVAILLLLNAGAMTITVGYFSDDNTFVGNSNSNRRDIVVMNPHGWVWCRFVPTTTDCACYIYQGDDRPIDSDQWTYIGSYTSAFTTAANTQGIAQSTNGGTSGKTYKMESDWWENVA